MEAKASLTEGMFKMLNNIKFARFISVITNWASKPMSVSDVERIQEMVTDIVEPATDTIMTTTRIRAEVDALFNACANGRKIEAIKAYRTLTHYGLKESKDAVEDLIRTCHDKYNSDSTYKA